MRHRTSDIRHRTSDSGHETSDVGHQCIRHRTGEIGHRTSDIGHSHLLSDSFDVETINTFILTSVVSSKPYPISDQKDQNLYPLSDRNGVAQRPHPLGRHIPIWFIEGSAPPPGGVSLTWAFGHQFVVADLIVRFLQAT